MGFYLTKFKNRKTEFKFIMRNKNVLALILVILISFSLTSYNRQSKSTKRNNKIMKWNFKNFKTLTFNYKQTISSNSLLFDSDDKSKNVTEISGVLAVEVTKVNLANIVLKDIVQTNFKLDTLGKQSKLITQEPTQDMMLIEGLQEDGSVTGAYNPEFVFFSKVFFPIINKEIGLKNTYALPLSVPFGAAGSTINIKGDNMITYVSNDNELAKLETVINVAEFSEPTNLVDTYTCSLKGNSNYSFNLKKGFFTNGQIGLKMAMGKKDSDQMDMDMDVKIRLDLKAVKQ